MAILCALLAVAATAAKADMVSKDPDRLPEIKIPPGPAGQVSRPSGRDSVVVRYLPKGGEETATRIRTFGPVTLNVRSLPREFAAVIGEMRVGDVRSLDPQTVESLGLPGIASATPFDIQLLGIIKERAGHAYQSAKEPASPKPGVLQSTIKEGMGSAGPGPNDTVVVHVATRSEDGRLIYGTDGASPITLKVANSMAPLRSALRGMAIGQRVQLIIPKDLVDRRHHGLPAGKLFMELELLEIKTDRIPTASEDITGL